MQLIHGIKSLHDQTVTYHLKQKLGGANIQQRVNLVDKIFANAFGLLCSLYLVSYN